MGDPNTPASGVGSSLDATRELRKQLPLLLKQLEAKSLLDVGCGDFTWMREVELPCAYTGVDIVPSVVASNKYTYSSAERTFALCDAVSDDLPDGDIVLCREVLFHLSFTDAKAALRNILSGQRRYLLATTDRATQFNADIPSGDFRLLNLELRPFKFPLPLFEIDDCEVTGGRIIGVWPAEDIRSRFPE